MSDNSQSGFRPDSPQISLRKAPEYRTGYANSVQVRLSVWDFLLNFGTMHQPSPESLEVEDFQGIYLSPQQAKALHALLGQNLAQYEAAFGTISLDTPKADTPAFAGGPRPVQ